MPIDNKEYFYDDGISEILIQRMRQTAENKKTAAV